jgi:hypothetical protein
MKNPSSSIKQQLGVVAALFASQEAGAPKYPKRPRPPNTNWGIDHPRNAAHLRLALSEWRDGVIRDNWTRKSNLTSFLKEFNERWRLKDPSLPNIPPSTFRDRLKDGRDPASVKMGRPALISIDNTRTIADVLCEFEAGNQPKSRAYMARTMLRDVFGLTPRQARNFFHHTLKNVKRDGQKLLFAGTADPLTKKRTAAITEDSQRTYFSMIDGVRKQLYAYAPEPDAQGRTYKELESHFVGNGDEEIALASADKLAILGSRNKRHHFKNAHDSRDSISMLRFGTATGAALPTYYLIAAEHRKSGFGSQWLEERGNAPGYFACSTRHCSCFSSIVVGSTILCNDRGYMTNETWLKIVPLICKAIRSLPVVRDHPTWWFRLHLDGLVSHHCLLQANVIFACYRIWVIIEWPHSSHVNQAFDHDPARAAKQALTEIVPEVRDSLGFVTNNPLDQWGLLIVVASLAKAIRPQHWINGFKRCVSQPSESLH